MEKEMETVNLLIPSNIFRKIKNTARMHKISTSEFIRKAIVHYIRLNETARIKRELEEGYKANYEYYERQQNDWSYADAV